MPALKLMTTEETADFLTRLGVRTSARTLVEWRYKKTGPDYLRVQGRGPLPARDRQAVGRPGRAQTRRDRRVTAHPDSTLPRTPLIPRSRLDHQRERPVTRK
jgi:hypothetical protein